MPFEFIQVPAHGGSSGKEELNRLLRSGRIVSVRKEFVAAGEDSFWAFCVEFLEGPVPVEKGRGMAKVDYREVLGEEEFLMFSKLRDWRRTMVEKESTTVGTNVPGGMTFAEAPGRGPTEPAPRPYIQPMPHL